MQVVSARFYDHLIQLSYDPVEIEFKLIFQAYKFNMLDLLLGYDPFIIRLIYFFNPLGCLFKISKLNK